MHNSDQEKQDQRPTSGMEDSAAMTIDFLRARLLAERSVSRSARQRADELAKRVTDLAEQLKVATLQRKKAEKATADIRTILGNNGVSDVSDGFDSSSDQESHCDSKVGNGSDKEDDSVNSKSRTNDSDEFSGSELDFSSASQKSLRWKGRKNTLNPVEKYKDSYLKRRTSFASVSSSSSPKHCVGKSCRQIRRRESRSVTEEQKMDPKNGDLNENGEVIASGVAQYHSNGGPEILSGRSEARQENSHSDSGEYAKEVTNSNSEFNGFGGEDDMEKALQDQAQLIGRYEEMEKAQREWEERFRENNSSSPESCDPGNQSDVTEERDETKAQPPHPATIVSSQVQDVKSEEKHAQNSNTHLPTSCDDSQQLYDKNHGKTPVSETIAQQSSFPIASGNQKTLEYRNDQHGHSFTNSPLIGSSEGEVSPRNKPYALVPHEMSKAPSGVLEALKQAKLSLQQQISLLPRIESGSVVEKVEIPVGCPGLFRLPTDFPIKNESRSNFLISGHRPTSHNSYPYTGLEVTPHDRVFANSYGDNARSVLSSALATRDHPFVSLPSSDTVRSSFATNGTPSRVSTRSPSFDFNLDTGVIPSSVEFTYPAVPSFPDMMRHMPANEGFSMSRPVGMPPNNHSSFPHDDYTRAYMYR